MKDRYIMFSCAIPSGFTSITVIVKGNFPSHKFVKQQVRIESGFIHEQEDINIIGWCEFKDYDDYICFTE